MRLPGCQTHALISTLEQLRVGRASHHDFVPVVSPGNFLWAVHFPQGKEKIDLLHSQILVKRRKGVWKQGLMFSKEVRIQLALKFRGTGGDF